MTTKVKLGEKTHDGFDGKFYIGDVCLVNGKMCVFIASIFRSDAIRAVNVFRTLDLGEEKPTFIHDLSCGTKIGDYTSIDKTLERRGKMVCDTDYMYIATAWWESFSRGSYLFSTTL